MLWIDSSFLFSFLFFFCSFHSDQNVVVGLFDSKATTVSAYNLNALLNYTLSVAKYELQAEEYAQMEHGAQSQSRKLHQSVKFTATTEEIGRASNINLRAFQLLTKKYGVAKRTALKLLEKNLIPFCAAQRQYRTCDSDNKYRTIDGTCNNLKNPYWGASFTAFHRLVPASYIDAFDEPRGGREESSLPNARLVSTTVHPDLLLPDAVYTNMVGQFGQFVDHDLTLTPEGDKMCCEAQRDDVDCWNINIFANDTFYSRHGQTCMEFTRSTPYCFPTSTGIREQMNILTAYADASNVYGSEEIREQQLRSFENGRLRMSKGNERMLPTVKEVEETFGERIEFMGLFLAGDERVNEMPGLTVMHNLWTREHNRVADMIKELRPNWLDEEIFQEARRLVIAEWQNILYGEYLPIILGPATMKEYTLDLGSKDSYSTYNPKVNATISHSFATAAYRFGHTLINGVIRLIKRLQPVGSYQVRNHYFDASQILQSNGDGYNMILEGLVTQSAQVYDPFVTEDLSNFLLKKKEFDFGADLIARNLQRGRDHGLQGYNAYRDICGLPVVTSWDNPPEETTISAWNKLSTLYEKPDDIDLFTGGLIEKSVPGGITGPTFNCLKALQFYSLKFGDRFFFTHKDQVGSFTRKQLINIRSRKLSDIICDNSNLEFVPSNVFFMISAKNQMISCTKYGKYRSNLDVSLFLE